MGCHVGNGITIKRKQKTLYCEVTQIQTYVLSRQFSKIITGCSTRVNAKRCEFA